jgi:F1F0 ATPase subunit 2
MIDPLSAVLGLAGGLLLGAVFFGGLWWTVRIGLASNSAGLWFAGSYLLRFAVLLAGLYLLAHDDAVRGIAAALGLILARLAAVRLGVAGKARALRQEQSR